MKSHRQTQDQIPPKLSCAVLEITLPAHIKDQVLGDLQEEYGKRLPDNAAAARRWYRYQALRTVVQYFSQFLGSDKLLKVAVILASFILVPVIFVMVAWLSNVDDTTERVLQYLLAGDMHKVAITREFWAYAVQSVSQQKDLFMYVNMPSVMWASVSLFWIGYKNKKQLMTAHQLALWGSALMLLPYLLGTFYLSAFAMPPRVVGPIIAFMLLSLFYLLVPVTCWVMYRLRQGSADAK